MTEDKKETVQDIVQDDTLKIFESLPEKFYSHDEIQSICIKLLLKDNLSFIHLKPFSKIYFIINESFDRMIAIVHLNYGKIKGIEQNKRDMGSIGKRTTYNLKDVEPSLANKSIDSHFGRTKFDESFKDSEGKDPQKTAFRNNKDLHFDIIRITNGLGTNFKYADNLGCSGKYAGESDEELNNNILLRSLTHDEIPFHDCFIDRDIIKQAFYSLAPEFFAHFLIWYLPEMKIPDTFDKSDKKEIIQTIKQWKKYKNSPAEREYKKAWRMKNVSIEMLRLRIIGVQSHE
jgi:hypothetical protein